jgi:hypothetical protein
MGRPVKPAGKYGSFGECFSFPRQEDENHLSYILSKMGVADLTQGRGIDKTEMTINNLLESLSGSACRIFLQQLQVIHKRAFLHNNGRTL